MEVSTFTGRLFIPFKLIIRLRFRSSDHLNSGSKTLGRIKNKSSNGGAGLNNNSGGPWGSISRVFARASKQRKTLDLALFQSQGLHDSLLLILYPLFLMSSSGPLLRDNAFFHAQPPAYTRAYCMDVRCLATTRTGPVEKGPSVLHINAFVCFGESLSAVPSQPFESSIFPRFGESDQFSHVRA